MKGNNKRLKVLSSSSSSSSSLSSFLPSFSNIGNVLVSHVFSFLNLVEYFQLANSNQYLKKISQLQTSKPDTITVSGNSILDEHGNVLQQLIDLQPRQLAIDNEVHVNSVQLLTRLESLQIQHFTCLDAEDLISLDECSRLQSLELRSSQRVFVRNPEQLLKLINVTLVTHSEPPYSFQILPDAKYLPNLTTFQNSFFDPFLLQSLQSPSPNLTSLHVSTENFTKEQDLIHLLVCFSALRSLHVGNIDFKESDFTISSLQPKYGTCLEEFRATVTHSSRNLCKILGVCTSIRELHFIQESEQDRLLFDFHLLNHIAVNLTKLILDGASTYAYSILSIFVGLTSLSLFSPREKITTLDFLTHLPKLTSLKIDSYDYGASTVSLPNIPSLRYLYFDIPSTIGMSPFLLLEELVLGYRPSFGFQQLNSFLKLHPRLKRLWLEGKWYLKLVKKPKVKDFLFQFLLKWPQLRDFFIQLPYREIAEPGISEAIDQLMKHRRHFFLAFTEQSQKEIWDRIFRYMT